MLLLRLLLLPLARLLVHQLGSLDILCFYLPETGRITRGKEALRYRRLLLAPTSRVDSGGIWASCVDKDYHSDSYGAV